MAFLYERRARHDNGYLIHILCWMVLIFLEVVVAGALQQRFSNVFYYIFFYSLNIFLFYFHSGFVMEYSAGRDIFSRVRFILIFLFELLVYSLISMLLSLFIEKILGLWSDRPTIFNFRYFAVVLYRAAFFIAYATGYFFLKQYLKRKKIEMRKTIENEQLRSQLLVMENDFLRAQINPHFLFNTLSFIKIASKRNSERSDEAIDRLSLMMDYALAGAKGEFIPIALEVEQIDHVVRLNQLRYDQKLNIDLIKDIDDETVQIIPMVLLTLVENIFKHGNLLHTSSPTSIKILSNNATLSFQTRNLIADSLKSKNGPMGLRNIKSRLERSYPDKHSFTYGSQGDVFYTDLRICF